MKMFPFIILLCAITASAQNPPRAIQLPPRRVEATSPVVEQYPPDHVLAQYGPQVATTRPTGPRPAGMVPVPSTLHDPPVGRYMPIIHDNLIHAIDTLDGTLWSNHHGGVWTKVSESISSAKQGNSPASNYKGVPEGKSITRYAVFVNATTGEAKDCAVVDTWVNEPYINNRVFRGTQAECTKFADEENRRVYKAMQ